jgi:hypothetical protein
MAFEPDFEPDETTLGLLRAEHVNGSWVGNNELLPIANKIRNQGGDEDDYRRWVKASNLWMSYVGSTSDTQRKQESTSSARGVRLPSRRNSI